jgi:hypothetical protein
MLGTLGIGWECRTVKISGSCPEEADDLDGKKRHTHEERIDIALLHKLRIPWRWP